MSVLLVGAIAVLMYVGLLAPSEQHIASAPGGGAGNSSQSIDPDGEAPAVGGAPADRLCEAFEVMATAHNEHASPLAQISLDRLGGGEADTAAADRQVGELSGLILEATDLLDGLVFPEGASAVANLRSAVAGYARGVATALEARDAGNELWFTFVASMNDGRPSLDATNADIQLLYAAGLVPCSGRYP